MQSGNARGEVASLKALDQWNEYSAQVYGPSVQPQRSQHVAI